MPESINASASDAASSDFYSSPDEDAEMSTRIGQTTQSAEELEMPTEDDEEVSSGNGGSSPSCKSISEPSAIHTSSILHESGPSPSIGVEHFADDNAHCVATRYLERKRKRESTIATIPIASVTGADTLQQREAGTSSPVLAHLGPRFTPEPGPDTAFKAEPSPKRTKVSPPRSPAMEGGSSATTATTLSSHKNHLPVELWQQVFTFVPPVSLGRLLRVNHAFNACLTANPKEQSSLEFQRHGVVNLEEADAIWSASRKLFCPGLPRPLGGSKELDMWRLIRGRNCQFCGKVDSSTTLSNATDPWEAGLGKDGVRVIWAFAIRCCGPCLLEKSEKVGMIKNVGNTAYQLTLKCRKWTYTSPLQPRHSFSPRFHSFSLRHRFK